MDGAFDNIYGKYASFTSDYCTCNRCPCCGKLVQKTYPQGPTVTWTCSDGSGPTTK